MVFYIKYRPQTIEELDSSDVRDKLFSVFSKDSYPHAFLFTGPKGLGKTSAARIVAKVINCEKLTANQKHLTTKKKSEARSDKLEVKSIEPCNKCEQCLSIKNGTNMDILEIDAASNRGIDEIRDLREKIKLAPLSAKKKVYIIDEVHMLTTEAFNALLKTLEEPPKHVVFILCTTESHKLPDTIVSRCFHIAFKLAKKEELMRSFERIAKQEKIPVEKDAIELVAGLSEGSFRDGTKILEEVFLSLKDGKVTKELVEEKYQVSNIKHHVSEMIAFLENRDTKKSLELVSKLVDQGVDIKFFIEKMIEQLHSHILKNVGIKDDASELDSKLTIEELKTMIELMTKAYGELKYAVLQQLPLEIAIIQWGENAQNNPLVSFRPSALRTSTVSLAEPLRLEEAGADQNVDNNAEKDKNSQRSSASGSASINDKRIIQEIQKEEIDLWKNLIDKVKARNHSLAGILRSCSLDNYDKKILKIRAGYKFHKDKLAEPKSKEIIEVVWKDLTGDSVGLMVFLEGE